MATDNISLDRIRSALSAAGDKHIRPNKKLASAFLVLLALGIPGSNASAGPDPQTTWMTLSGRGAILEGETFTNVSLDVPVCPRNKEFLVLSVHVGPEVLIGATSTTVVNLPNWAASVPVFQRFTNGTTVQVALTVLGQGPEHISATLPAGQGIGGDPLRVSIILLGGAANPHRFEFNVHATGACGTASIMEP